MLENGVDEEALGKERAGRLKLLLNAFDKNKNGKIDPDERQAVVDFMTKRALQEHKPTAPAPAQSQPHQ